MESLNKEKEGCDGTHCHTLAMRVGFAVIVDQLNSIMRTITTVKNEAVEAYEKETGRPYKELKPSPPPFLEAVAGEHNTDGH